MNGYCIMITDEGASFLGDLKRYETKHESYISLLNQLFDGKGDKMTLAKNVERPVPWNSTSISIGVQQKSYCDAIHGLTETLWLDNGFSERFIFTTARPYRLIFVFFSKTTCKYFNILICIDNYINFQYAIVNFQTQVENKQGGCKEIDDQI